MSFIDVHIYMSFQKIVILTLASFCFSYIHTFHSLVSKHLHDIFYNSTYEIHGLKMCEEEPKTQRKTKQHKENKQIDKCITGTSFIT